MKKVYQTIIDSENGDCMQAVVASLFELELDALPNYVEHENWGELFDKTYAENGYPDYVYFDTRNLSLKLIKEILEYDGGINGFFYATVMSQTLKGVTHAVVIDKNCKVVHDPNPNQLALKLNWSDVRQIRTHNHNWSISEDKKIRRL